MKLRPLHDNVLVKRSEEQSKKVGSLFVPDSAQEKPQEAEVIAVGSGRLLEDGTVRELAVKVGDTVVYSKYGGTEVKLDGEDYVLLDEDQIYALVVNE